jgi:hypothetical protein
MKTFLFFIICIFVSELSSFAQQSDSLIITSSEISDTSLLEDNNASFKPIIGFGLGVFSFYGDVKNYLTTPTNGLTSYRLSMSRNINNYFDIEFHGSFGSVTGNENDNNTNRNLNFKTNLFIGGVDIYYNFNHLLTRQRPIHPYISIGAEIVQFAPKGDLLTSDKSPYYYWQDGTIRNVEESTNSIGYVISRDYNYETDLRNKDLYGYGSYSKTSFSVPVDVGFNVTVSNRVKCRIGTTFHFTMTDYIDNIKNGDNFYSNDIILNSYVALSVDLFSSEEELIDIGNFKNMKFIVTDKQDEDNDGIDDFNDECPGTPEGVKIDFNGCPLDNDSDGVPDYMDKQKDTPPNTIGIDKNGVSLMNVQLIVLLYNPDAINRSEVKLYSKTTKANSNIDPKNGIPDKFKSVDTDNNNYISHEELQQAIESIFEGNSTLTPNDIYELQEFFFNQ